MANETTERGNAKTSQGSRFTVNIFQKRRERTWCSTLKTLLMAVEKWRWGAERKSRGREQARPTAVEESRGYVADSGCSARVLTGPRMREDQHRHLYLFHSTPLNQE